MENAIQTLLRYSRYFPGKIFAKFSLRFNEDKRGDKRGQTTHVLARWTEPITLGYKHQSWSETGTMPPLVARIAQKNPLGMISFTALLTSVLILGFLDIALS